MPFHLNKVMLSGTLTRDPEVKFTPKGTAVGNISLAINRKYKTDNGTVEETTFVEVEAWGKTAEIIQEHTGKGHTIFIEGRLKLEKWDDKETGKKRTKLKIVAEEFKFVSSPKDSEKTERPPQRPADKPKPPPDPDLDQPEDDIPFD